MDADNLCDRGAHLDTTTNIRGSAKRNAAFTLQHGAMLTPRQPEGCVPVVVSRCARDRAIAHSTLALVKDLGVIYGPMLTKGDRLFRRLLVISASFTESRWQDF